VDQSIAIESSELEGSDQPRGPEFLAELFDRHQQRLYRLARRLSRDEEESRDLVQETFLRAARRPASLPGRPVEAEAWLIRVLVNLCRDRHRRQVVRQRPAVQLVEPAIPSDPEGAAVARATVRAALARLAPRRRAVVVLRELEDVPVRKIAELLGLARVTVRWHLAAGRKELARILTTRQCHGVLEDSR